MKEYRTIERTTLLSDDELNIISKKGWNLDFFEVRPRIDSYIYIFSKYE
jgi:hypothetical protein